VSEILSRLARDTPTLIHHLFHLLGNIFHSAVDRIEERVKAITKPAVYTLIEATAADLLRSKRELIAENAFLRQPLIVLERHVKQPTFTPFDRGLLVLLASRLRYWKQALHIIKPETLLKWHRQGFKLFWKYKSQGQIRQPRIAEETIALINRMAVENRRWGTKRIRGELLKLGLQVNRGTIRRYMRQARREIPPRHTGQTWATFLANHAPQIWACDFLQSYDVFFRTLFLFFIIEHGSRRVVHFAVTRAPGDAWVAQQIREATGFGVAPRFLICDNDDKYGVLFERAVAGVHTELLHTPFQAPKANALCERFLGTVRRECLDHLLIFSASHARRVIREYVTFFNHRRPHQGINQQIPQPLFLIPLSQEEPRQVIGLPVLHGLHHDYRRAA
jgi:putative transposase